MSDHFDIVIVGGGMVGATLASVLTRHHYRVALIEAHEFKQGKQPAFDERSIAFRTRRTT